MPVPPASAKKVPETTSDDDEDTDEDASDDESTEQTSEGLETAAKPAPAIPQAAIPAAGASMARSNSKLVATKADGRAAPKGYMSFTRKSLAAAAIPGPAAGRGRRETDSEPSDLSEEDDDDDEETIEPPRRSRDTPAAALAASVVVERSLVLAHRLQSAAPKLRTSVAKLPRCKPSRSRKPPKPCSRC